ncbi:MAG: GTPase HflX [Lachnospiraceae bacterium]|nr:GTPase HflX [Lachnospiraceae bacterium]
MEENWDSFSEEQQNRELERVLLVGVDTGEEQNFDGSMEELKQLAKACYMEPVGTVTQRMEFVHKALYIGTGKVQEVRDAAQALDAQLILFNDTLTPSQIKNLQDELKTPVIDRTTLILNIFEMRARTREASLQVETAKLQYLLPRLVGMHEALTRQGGTSGSMSSRGAGEKKLELDRRHIEHRISELRKELDAISRERETQRKRRKQSRIPLVALVGYTNAGKSTIMNQMVERFVGDEEKKVLEKDMLFATLDTTIRRINTGNNRDFLLTDTVGFIHKLPHGLVKAFRSTLEEIKGADLLLQVVDVSDPGDQEQMETTKETLWELGAGDIPMLIVFNKADRLIQNTYPRTAGTNKIYISARQPESIELLVKEITRRVYAGYEEVRLLIPYDKGSIVSYLQENAQILEQTYEPEGTWMHVSCHHADARKYEQYVVK